jgi:hypothetical protein
MDVIRRQPVSTRGRFDAAAARVSTYALVGADYFLFFAAMMTVAAVLFIFVARKYREHSYVRDAGAAVAAP